MLKLPPKIRFLSKTVEALGSAIGTWQEDLFRALDDGFKGEAKMGKEALWEDFRFPALTMKRRGISDPSFMVYVQDSAGTSPGVWSEAFSASALNELSFDVQLPHGWVEGSEIRPHIHWGPASAAAGNVVWGLEYSWANVNAKFPYTTTIKTVAPAAGVFPYNGMVSLPPIDGTGMTISSILKCRIYRDGAATDDTYGGLAHLHEVDFHIQVNSLGSREEFTK